MKTYTFTNIFDKKSYTVAASDDNKLFCLQDNEAAAGAKCKYWIKVKEDHERKYTYKIQKTQIRAINGAAGLVDFIEWAYTDNICECGVNIIIKAILEGKVKEAA